MTITSVATPAWVTYNSHTKPGTRIHDKIGLYRRCMSIEDGVETCSRFPDEKKCPGTGDDGSGEDEALCSMWRTTGFLMCLAIVGELATLVGFLIVLAGGKQKREGGGWKVLGGILVLIGLLEFLGMAFVVCSLFFLPFTFNYVFFSFHSLFPPSHLSLCQLASTPQGSSV